MEWGVIIATLLGPIFAVQAQKWIERGREQRNKQLQIFHILMATRAIRASSADHVQALNSIDLYFNKRNRREKSVVDSWNVYFDHLNSLSDAATLEETKRWNDEAGKLLVDLLGRLSTYLGYDFDQVQLKRGVYFPKFQGEEMAAQAEIRDSFLRVLRGEQPINMSVVDFPYSKDAADQQNRLNTAIMEALSGESPLVVRMSTERVP